jgi:hypothetical protein
MKRKKLDVAITALVVLNVVAVGALLAVVLLDRIQSVNAGIPGQSESASASPGVMTMGLAHIPTSNACILCHESGGSVGLKVVPAIGHPLEGWRRCASCHSGEKLGRTAPGHDGIPETECLNCHKVATAGPTITQPHSKLQDQKCLDCHGTYAHLPTSMVSKKETECWLCHKPQALPPPEYPHAADANLSCRQCHQSAETGALPMDHALRADNTCLLCHDIKRVPASPGASPLASPGTSPIASPDPSPGASAGG